MYAVVRTGGKQYRVQEGDVLKVEKLDGDVGAKIALEVLLVGAATKNGTDAACAARASGYVPILLAVSPLRAIRSAPTTTQPIRPLASREAAATSGSRVTGMPSCKSSQAVSLEPWSQGRVSSA